MFCCCALVRARLTDHHARRHGVPLQPEGDERAGDQDHAGDEDRGEVERAVPREDQVHLQAAVVTCARNLTFSQPSLGGSSGARGARRFGCDLSIVGAGLAHPDREASGRATKLLPLERAFVHMLDRFLASLGELFARSTTHTRAIELNEQAN